MDTEDKPLPAGRRCWAACLGSCDPKITGEHVVSRSVFIAPTVKVHGFSWCKEKPKEVGVGAITKNVLCARHNSDLSPTDVAAGRAFQVLRDSLELSRSRLKLLAWEIPKLERLTIDASLLERWLLKTLLNLYVASANRIGPYAAAAGDVPEELVAIAFGKAPFLGHAGMYFAANAGMNFTFEDQFVMTSLTDDDERVLGACFELHGLRFVLHLQPELEPPVLGFVRGMDPAWQDATLYRRIESVRVKHLSWTSHFIDFARDANLPGAVSRAQLGESVIH